MACWCFLRSLTTPRHLIRRLYPLGPVRLRRLGALGRGWCALGPFLYGGCYQIRRRSLVRQASYAAECHDAGLTIGSTGPAAVARFSFRRQAYLQLHGALGRIARATSVPGHSVCTRLRRQGGREVSFRERDGAYQRISWLQDCVWRRRTAVRPAGAHSMCADRVGGQPASSCLRTILPIPHLEFCKPIRWACCAPIRIASVRYSNEQILW